MSPFLNLIRSRHPELANLLQEKRDIPGSVGWHLVVPSPAGSDLARPLDIDEDEYEITISLDLAHLHFNEDTRGNDALWDDPGAFLEAVLAERIVATTAFLNGRMKIGGLIGFGEEPSLYYTLNVDHVRARTWRCTHDWDDVKINGVWKRLETRVSLPLSK
jgi:hypothetical protein